MKKGSIPALLLSLILSCEHIPSPPKIINFCDFKWLKNWSKNEEIESKNDSNFESKSSLKNRYFEEKVIDLDGFMIYKELDLTKNEYMAFKMSNNYDNLYNRPYILRYELSIFNDDGTKRYKLKCYPKDDWDTLYRFYEDNFGLDSDKFKEWLETDCTFKSEGNDLDKSEHLITTREGNCNAYSNIVVGYFKYLKSKQETGVKIRYKISLVDNEQSLYHLYPIMIYRDKEYNLDFTDKAYNRDIQEAFKILKENINYE